MPSTLLYLRFYMELTRRRLDARSLMAFITGLGAGTPGHRTGKEFRRRLVLNARGFTDRVSPVSSPVAIMHAIGAV